MDRKSLTPLIQTVTAIIATAYGMITIWVGGMTLLGFSDPGYVIFIPLLIYNSVMGFFYTTTGVLIWRQHPNALQMSQIIFGLNALVLVLISLLYWINFDVAFDSVKAMSLRTVVWLIIWWSLSWLQR